MGANFFIPTPTYYVGCIYKVYNTTKYYVRTISNEFTIALDQALKYWGNFLRRVLSWIDKKLLFSLLWNRKSSTPVLFSFGTHTYTHTYTLIHKQTCSDEKIIIYHFFVSSRKMLFRSDAFMNRKIFFIFTQESKN
jgi:hypothetical protein